MHGRRNTRNTAPSAGGEEALQNEVDELSGACAQLHDDLGTDTGQLGENQRRPEWAGGSVETGGVIQVGHHLAQGVFAENAFRSVSSGVAVPILASRPAWCGRVSSGVGRTRTPPWHDRPW